MEDSNELVTREYDVSMYITTVGRRAGGGDWDSDDPESSIQENNNKLKQMLIDAGVDWPEGSSLAFFYVKYRFSFILRITNTPRNLDVIEKLLREWGFLHSIPLVTIDLQIIAFRTKDIEKLQLSRSMTKEALFDLRKTGKAKVVSMASVMTRNSVEASVKAVQEVLYPTALKWEGDPCDSNQVSRSGSLVPSDFVMREVGIILKVLPEIGEKEEIIYVTLFLERTTLERWETYSATVATEGKHTTLQFRQPVFDVASLNTMVTMKDGDTILLGSGTTADGDWVHVGFLTVKLQDVK